MTRSLVAVIDGGGANLASLRFALERLGAECVVTSEADVIRNASHVILPGVGAAAAAMEKLQEKDLVHTIRAIEQPFLGICLGMQLLGAGSEEDAVACLGIVPEHAVRLTAEPGNPVPNMGWCQLENVVDHPLLDGIVNGAWVYFIHSYALPVTERVIATSRHARPFAAALASGNFHGTQFHPERSSAAGARLLQNFLGLGS